MEVAAATLFGGHACRIPIAEASQVGHCRRIAQRLAESQGFDETAAGRVSIVATELANNVLRHAGSGEMLVQAFGDAAAAELEIIALDKGPGIRDVERSLRDGFSTGGTAGTGLGAVLRLSQRFDIYSLSGKGTAVLARIAARPTRVQTPAAPLEWGGFVRALPGEEQCGDRWKIALCGDKVAILMADGLGHGLLAAHASDAAAAAFGEAPFRDPTDTLQAIHGLLSGGRGAAAACALIHTNAAKVIYAGVGNISGSVVSAESSRGMVSHNGTLGVQLRKLQQFEYPMSPGTRVVMHSDGLSARWRLTDYPGLMQRHCGLMAAVLYRDHGRARDDAGVVVVGRHP